MSKIERVGCCLNIHGKPIAIVSTVYREKRSSIIFSLAINSLGIFSLAIYLSVINQAIVSAVSAIRPILSRSASCL